MKFQQHYSGSSGNLYTLTSDSGARLLIECGVPWVMVEKALDYDLKHIHGCLISHEHKDHCESVLNVITSGINVYLSDGTRREIGIISRRFNVMKYLHEYQAGPFKIIGFNTQHDCKEPFGFIVQCDDEWFLYATDTAYIKQKFSMQFAIIAIECSYDKEVLKRNIESGNYSEQLGKRLIETHMEKTDTINYIEKHCDLTKCRELHLIHVSNENMGDKEGLRKEFNKRFMINTVVKE